MKLTDKKVLIGIAVVIVVVVVVAAILVMSSLSKVVFLKSGDYVEFDVTGTNQYGSPISGQMIMTFSNVNSNSYDVHIEYPGLGIATVNQHVDSVPALTTLADLGSKTQSNVKLMTAFGNKTVDVYSKTTEGQVWTSYAGDDPLVQYKIVVTVGEGTMTFELSETNIEKVRTGNS